MINILCVGIGGFIGAIIRYLISSYTSKIFLSKIPIGTLLVNVIGGFFIGLIMQISVKTNSISPHMKLFLTTGFLGGLTTFSTFSYETLMLVEGGEFVFATINIILNLFLSLGGVSFGKFIIK